MVLVRIKILINNQESCVINGGKTTEYSILGRDARQGDPISAFLFVLALEILSLLIKTKPEIAGLTIFDHCYLYSAYADDTTFFYKEYGQYFSFIFVILWIKTKLIKMRDYRYWSPERGSSGSLWYALCRSKK